MKDEGFTLVELLVALAIVGVTAGLLFAALSTGGAAWRRGGAASGADETVAAAQALLREQIERLAPADAGADASPPGGTAHRFAFLAEPPEALRLPGLQPTSLSLASDGRLMLATGGTALPLIDRVRTIDLAYYGPAFADPTPRWRASWGGDADPPRLVRIRIGFAPGDPRGWPDLVVRPAVTVAAACRVDPERGTCA